MQHLLVFLIVSVAAGYAAWQLMPRVMRRWLIGRMMIIAPSHGTWLARMAAGAENSGCRSCKGCSSGRQASAPQGRAGSDAHRPGVKAGVKPGGRAE
jgi:hypothetical protein